MKNVKEKLLTILLTFCMLIGLAPTGTHAADPSVSYKAAWNEDGTAISLTVESAAAGTVYYTVQEATEPDPVYIAANEAVCSAGMNTFTIAQSTQTAKNIYLSYEDSDGNQYSNAKMELGAYWTGTEVTGEPSGVIEKGTVTIEGSRLSADSISLTATSTVDGNLYYIVKPSSEDANNAPIGSADCTFPFQRCGRECLLGDKDTTFPAYNTSSYSAQVESYNPNLGTVGEGYSNISLTLTVTNTGEQPLSFSVDTTDSEYETFKNYFTVDVTNTLGPNSVTITVAETGDSTAGVTIPDEFLYSPYRSNIRSSRLYKYMIGNELTFYKKKYGLLSNVSNKVLDSYTGLNPSADPIVYPPNNYGYVPVKTGSDTVRDLAFHGRDRL